MGWYSRYLPARLRGEQKAAVSAPVNAVVHHPMAGLLNINPAEMTPYQAMMLYKSVGPFAKIINLIADSVASLMPVVEIDGQAVDGHPVLNFLNRPGSGRTRRRFVKELVVQYLVTGTAYIHCYGNPDMPPLALDILKSQHVAPIVGADMWPGSYLYAEGTRSVQFQRDDNPRDARWFDSMGLSEIIAVYDIDGNQRGVGLSRLNSIRSDVELRLKGIVHNMGLLDNGARVGGVLSFKNGMTPDQKDDVGSQLRSMMTGAQNAGRLAVVAGGEYSFENMIQNARDMDFAKLIEIVEDSMASAYNVPVSLFRTSAQTNNNYETAWNVLYDQAILPTFEVVYSALANMFSLRLGQDIAIKHDSLTTPVLARQASARARDLYANKIISRNEARQICGYEPVLGGDTIYGPMGEVPVAEDLFTSIDQSLGRDRFDEIRAERTGTDKPTPAGVQPKPEEDVGGGKPGVAGGRDKEKPARTPMGSARDDARSEKAYSTLNDFLDRYRLTTGTVH